MKKLLFLVAMIIGMATPSQAQTNDYEKAISDFLVATNAKSTMEATLVQTYNSMGLKVTDMNALVKELYRLHMAGLHC